MYNALKQDRDDLKARLKEVEQRAAELQHAEGLRATEMQALSCAHSETRAMLDQQRQLAAEQKERILELEELQLGESKGPVFIPMP